MAAGVDGFVYFVQRRKQWNITVLILKSSKVSNICFYVLMTEPGMILF